MTYQVLIASNSVVVLKDAKEAFKDKLRMNDLGKISHFLGIYFTHDDNYITMGQKKLFDKFPRKIAIPNIYHVM